MDKKMKKTLFTCLPLIAILSGCSDSMYDKCFLAETQKLESMPPAALNVVRDKYQSPYYSSEVHDIFSELVKTAELEVDDYFTFYDSEFYTEELGALIERSDKLEKDEALNEVNKAKSKWRDGSLTWEEYNKTNDKCRETPACLSALEKYEAARDVFSKEADRLNGIAKERFKSPNLNSNFISILIEHLEKFEKAELTSLFTPEMQLEYDRNAPKFNGLEWKYRILSVFIAEYSNGPTATDDDKWPFKEFRKKQYEYNKSGNFHKVIAERISPFITPISNEQIAMQVCNERGIYR